MAYDARTVANVFLGFGRRDNSPISPLKMQKLIYLAHGWNLVMRGERLVENDFEAWPYGPVVPEVYNALRRYGATAITEPIVGFGLQLEAGPQGFVDAVWKHYCQFSGVQLSALTHEPGYAWDLTMKNSNPFNLRPVISNELIADEFQRRHKK
jgi:uncharacterized phage-associated protein